MVSYIDLKLQCIAGHAEIVINGQRIKCAADYDRVLGHVTPAALHEFSSQLSTIKAMLCYAMLEPRYEEVAKLFTYDRETGVLYWRTRNRTTTRHKYVAGTYRGTKDGYRQVGIKGKIYLEHRIIMMLCFGHIPENAEVDHINHVRDDNRLANLRFVTQSENMRNKSVSSKSTTGVTGVYFYKRLQKYIARIRVNREFIHLGTFETLKEAAEARRQADRKYKFNNNHGEGRAEYVRKKADA